MRAALTFGTPEKFSEVYLLEAHGSPKQLTQINPHVDNWLLPKVSVVRWKSGDGTPVEGILEMPADATPGQPVPLIVNIHGGPTSAWAYQMNYTYLGNVLFPSRGYAILRPNPRGSSGYGAEFRRANIQDWGGGDFQDLMTGVDKVIAMGVADPERLGVMGWSYGGFMTSWIVTQTQRFKAASAGAPVTILWR